MTLPLSYDINARVIQALDMIGNGKPPTEACRDCGIAYSTLMRRVKDDPTITDMYTDAKQMGFDTLADCLLHIGALSARTGAKDAKELGVASDNIKWYLSRLGREKFGDKVTVEHNHTADRAIVEALTRGRQRAFENSAKQIEHGVTDAVFEVLDEDLSQFI